MYKRVPPPSSSINDDEELGDLNTLHHQEGETQKDASCGEIHKNVSKKLWEKFKRLEKRTNDMTERSTEKRIKHLQKQVIKRVQEEITDPEDQDILREHDVKFTPYSSKQSRKRIHDKDSRLLDNRRADNIAGTSEGSSQSEGGENSQLRVDNSWQSIKPYLKEKDHLTGIDHGDLGPKTQLERSIDAAIHTGDFKEAEKLSDQLASREFGTKIANAFDAREFIKKKKIEEDSAKAKRKKSLPWVFQPKQRWETKGNM